MAKEYGNPSPRARRAWKLPDLGLCRAIRFGASDHMIYCLRDDAGNCRYALRFGSGFFCHHPKRAEIVAHTSTTAGDGFKIQ
jgi:hypothetical protein